MAQSTGAGPEFWLTFQLKQGLTSRNLNKALLDITNGWRRYALWGTMGLQDIRQRYRRSIIGPFWLTISMGVMVGALGILYGAIFKQDLHNYLPYLAAGFVTWGLISSLVMDGARAFISAEGLIKQLNAPLSVYVYRAVWSNLIIFAHNVWIYVVVALWFGSLPGWQLLLVIPGVFVLMLNGLWMGLLLGLLSTRFRDIPQIVASIVQVMFFITPIIWRQEMLPGRALFLDLNPFYYMVEIVRAPMLGQLPPLEIVLGVLLITVVGWALALFFYTVYRWRLAYWV
jgi:ABC-2 type transport system permease protein/lipopolysaccharide transport system permease protein